MDVQGRPRSKHHSADARLHVLLAREGRTGVVFRRGPTRQVATFLWDRLTDKFTLGQWLKGTIRERLSDLTPDGKHMIYFAGNGSPHNEARGYWTAISRVPWLRAIIFIPKGDTWGGGGQFLGNGHYWLNGGHYQPRQDRKNHLRRVDKPEAQIPATGWPDLYAMRLVRDGWTIVGSERGRGSTSIFERPLVNDWTLVKLAHYSPDPPLGRAAYWEEHSLRPTRGPALERPEWEWADASPRGVVFAAKGGLYRQRLTVSNLREPELLRDFNEDRFEMRAAPYM